MYSNNFYPDGLIEQDIDVLIGEAYDASDVEALIAEALDTAMSALLDGPATRRRQRRIERRTVSSIVRTLPASRMADKPDGREVA